MKDLSIGRGLGVCVWVDFAVNWLAEGWDRGRAAPLWRFAATSVSDEVILK